MSNIAVAGYHIYRCWNQEYRVRVAAGSGQEVPEDKPPHSLENCEGESVQAPPPAETLLDMLGARRIIITPLPASETFNP